MALTNIIKITYTFPYKQKILIFLHQQHLLNALALKIHQKKFQYYQPFYYLFFHLKTIVCISNFFTIFSIHFAILQIYQKRKYDPLKNRNYFFCDIISNMSLLLGKYKQVKKLGKGAYGQVILVQDMMGQQFAIKQITLKSLKSQPFLLQYLECEIECLKEMHSPYIMRLIDCEEDQNNKYLICEYCDQGDLLNYQAKQPNQVFTLERATQILSHVIMGLEDVHKEQYLHRDIKSTNILIKKDNGQQYFKLADFGFTKKSDQVNGTILGTENYMSPEIYKSQNYGYEVDMWSFGVLFFFMLNKQFPFKINPNYDIDRKYEQLVKVATNFSYKKTVEQSKKRILTNCTTEVQQLFKRIFAVSAKQRMTFVEIRKHPLFSSYFPIIQQSSKILYSQQFQNTTRFQSRIIAKRQHQQSLKESLQVSDLSVVADKMRNKNKFAHLSRTSVNRNQITDFQISLDKTFNALQNSTHKLDIRATVSDKFPQELKILQKKIDQYCFLNEIIGQFVNSKILEISEKLNLSYNLTKYYIVLLRNLKENMKSNQLLKIYPQRSYRWKHFCETSQYKQIATYVSELLSKAEMKFQFIYGQCELLLPEINRINEQFSENFDRQILQTSFNGDFKKSYRKATHYTFTRLRQYFVEAKKTGKKVQLKPKIYFLMTLLVISHLFAYIFEDITNLQVIFKSFFKEKKSQSPQDIYFSELHKWIAKTTPQQLNKVTTKIIQIYFNTDKAQK